LNFQEEYGEQPLLQSMINTYNTILSPGTDEIVEKKSRFIGYAEPVESEEQAYAFIEKIKKQHYDARHNCFAFAIGKENTLYRFSDDGEPQGTAGKPILEVITGKEAVNICIVVTRYFGGTLLGTGGLVRAYTEAAKLCLEAAGLVTMVKMKCMDVRTNYNDSGKVQYILNSNNVSIADTEYTSDVLFHAMVPVDMAGYIEKQITEATSARAEISITGEEFRNM
jgi:uncharacterized YigZ family protein